MHVRLEVSDTPRPRWADALLAVGFVVGIWLPLVVHWVKDDEVGFVAREQRNARPRPELIWTAQGLERFPFLFDRYYRDAFGFRRALITAHNWIVWFGFGLAPTDQMLRGEGDWLFFTGDLTMETHRGLRPFTDGELEGWRRLLEDRRDWLAERGIAYVFSVAPNKIQVYPEYAPAAVDAEAGLGGTRLDQLTAWMRERSDVPYLDLRDVILPEKAKDRPDRGDFLYFPLGTHWTDRGAWLGARAILQAAAARVPGIRPPEREDYELERRDDVGDSWAGRMYLNDFVRQQVWRYVPRESFGSHPVPSPDLKGKGKRFVHPDRSKPTAVFLHDSFGNWVRDFFRDHFSRLTCVGRAAFDANVIERERPDVVIEMIVERKLAILSPFQPRLSGARDLAQRFEVSERVLLDLALDAPDQGLETFSSGAEPPLQELTDEGLAVTVHSPNDRFRLPAFRFPPQAIPVLLVELTAPVETNLEVSYLVEGETEYDRSRNLVHSLNAGYNEVYVELGAEGLTGRLLLQPGSRQGTYLIHRVEARGVLP